MTANPAQPPRALPEEVMRGVRVLQSTAEMLRHEVSLSVANEDRLASLIDLGALVDGHLHPTNNAPKGAFAPWEASVSPVHTAASDYSDELKELHSRAAIIFALASARCLTLVLNGDRPSMEDLWWGVHTDFTYPSLRAALATLDVPDDTTTARFSAFAARTRVAHELDALFRSDDAIEAPGDVETILSFGRLYAPNPADPCIEAFVELGWVTYEHLADLYFQRPPLARPQSQD